MRKERPVGSLGLGLADSYLEKLGRGMVIDPREELLATVENDVDGGEIRGYNRDKATEVKTDMVSVEILHVGVHGGVEFHSEGVLQMGRRREAEGRSRGGVEMGNGEENEGEAMAMVGKHGEREGSGEREGIKGG